MSPSDIVKLPSRPPTAKIAYGSAPQQFAELRLPAGQGPFPIVAIYHGGCYGDFAAADYTAPSDRAAQRRMGHLERGIPARFDLKIENKRCVKTDVCRGR